MRGRAYAIVPLICWALVFSQKVDLGRPVAILWACHVATALLAIGIAARQRWLVEAMTLFHLVAGLPGWLTDWIVGGHTTWSSIVSHALTPLVGLWVLRFERWRWQAMWVAWGLYAVMMCVSWAFMDARLNINTAHRPWSALRPHFPSLWMWWAASLAVIGVALAAGCAAGRRLLRAR